MMSSVEGDVPVMSSVERDVPVMSSVEEGERFLCIMSFVEGRGGEGSCV